jgi:hypothetical protein
MAYLQKLKFTNVSRKSTVDPVMRKCDKLLGKLDEQRNTAEHALDGKIYTMIKR